MKKIVLLATLMLSVIFAQAQLETFKEKLKRKLEEAKERKTEKTIDNILNKSEEVVDKNVNKALSKKEKKEKLEKDKASSNELNQENANQTSNVGGEKLAANAPVKLSVTSKFDFIPGEKVLYYDDFSTTSVGDFPLGWNTNSSAEIVKLTGSEDKWLSITKDGYFSPDFVTNMPENFTLEFSVFNRYRSSNILSYSFIFSATDNPRRDLGEWYLTNMFKFNWAGCAGSASYLSMENSEEMGKNDGVSVPDLASKSLEFDIPVFAKFSVWRQKNRLRIYVNSNKIFDLPQAFNSKLKYNVFKLGASYMNYANGATNLDEFMVSNLRYSVGAPDTRNRLITEGKLVTRGILFDVNSDQIKPESNGVLKEIATVLQENPTVKVKIIGHTDSDGNAALNLDLSKRRSVAVKNALSTVFGVDASRLETDGKGAAEPSEPNTTPQGKANNRRVEFIKL